MKTITALLEGIVDYAGLFPPAALSLRETVANYAAYRAQPESWMLGRLILPLSRLDQFEPPADGAPWPLSVLATADLDADLKLIGHFNERFGQDRARIEAIEIKAATTEEIDRLAGRIPADLACFVEIPIENDPAPLLRALAQAGIQAKVRTGGVTAEAIPSAPDLARFLVCCAAEDLPFKATAGLHHPLRSRQRLTYEAESPSATMHGFLNLFLAAAFAQTGMEAGEVTELLDEASPEAFRFEMDSVFWRDRMAVVAHVRNMRHLFALSFGSCSFVEPVAELRQLGLIP